MTKHTDFADLFGLLGLGACGGNQVVAFRRYKNNYQSFYINSAIQDIKALGADVNYYQIPNALGCHRDRELSKEYLADNCDEILSKIKRFITTKYIFVFAGLGGGTASGQIAFLIDLIETELEKVCIPIGTLPNLLDDPPQAKINAYDCLRELIPQDDFEKKNHTLFLVDNNKQPSYYKSNQSLARLIHTLITDNGISESGNFDGGEILSMLQQSGYSIINSFNHHSSTFDYTSELKNAITGGIHADIEMSNPCYTLGIKTTSKKSSFHADFDKLELEYGYYSDRYIGYQTNNDILCMSGLSYPMTIIDSIYQAILVDKKNLRNDLAAKVKVSFKDNFKLDDLKQHSSKPTETTKLMSPRERLLASARKK